MTIKKMTPAKKAKGKADVLFSKIVRSPGLCRRCGRTENLQCAHVIPRVYSNTRCDEANAVCLCAKCHLFFTVNPVEFTNWLYDEVMSREFYSELWEQALQVKKVDWQVVAEHLALRWKELERV